MLLSVLKLLMKKDTIRGKRNMSLLHTVLGRNMVSVRHICQYIFENNVYFTKSNT